MKRQLRLGLAAILAVLLSAGAAGAHSRKEGTVPPDGAALAEPPDTIAMAFDAPIRVTFIALEDEQGDTIDFLSTTGPAPVTRYEATPPALDPGRYEVEWRGLSEDGHPVEGRFGFTVE